MLQNQQHIKLQGHQEGRGGVCGAQLRTGQVEGGLTQQAAGVVVVGGGWGQRLPVLRGSSRQGRTSRV